jgi:DNA repair protein RadC
LRRFKTLRGVLEADPEQLQDITGIGPYTVFVISFTQALAREFLKGKSLEMPTWNSSQEIFEYFYYSMRDLKKEVIKAVFLNSQNGVIEIKDISEGTVDSAQMYPREVIERALRCGAVGLVLVHNHPSGLPQPSQSDKELTRNLVFAGMTMQIKVLDHLIIGDNRYYSLAGEGLIARCENEYNSLQKPY